MKRIVFVLAVMIAVVCALAFFVGGPTISKTANASESPVAGPRGKLKPFHSEVELTSYLRTLTKKARARQSPASPSANAAGVSTESKAEMYVDGQAAKDDLVTNNQHAGVDEGGIVKLHGDYLLVLRRGRLFTVRIGDGKLRPVSVADAFGGEIDPNGTWYDEMLISGNTIAVIGYSYSRGGTEVGLFQIDDQGKLSYRSTYHLRSNDYYSSRNYASRLVDGKLVFYTPYYLPMYGDDLMRYFPAVRKWHKGAKENEFERIIPATQVYNGLRNDQTSGYVALHTVTACDIDGGVMSCQATGVIGPPGSVFYVSAKNVYVWASDWYGSGQGSMLYNMPLDGSAPSALGVTGGPVDQFSFLEDEDGYLNVLVHANSTGTGMWRSEVSAGDVALMRVSINSFSDGSQNVPEFDYRPLPKPDGYTFQNRFVGNYLLYGTGNGWWQPEKGKGSVLYAVDREGGDVTKLALPHGVDRIEALGSNAVVVGTDGSDLHFTSIRLDRDPEIADSKILRNAAQGELRSHGFFYKADGEESGFLGLPVREGGRPGYEHLFNESASISFFRNQSLRLSEVGQLTSRPERSANDNCRASCVDWYGNARPLFIRGRIFALLGYEIVEGSLHEGRISESRRINFAPGRTTYMRSVEE